MGFIVAIDGPAGSGKGTITRMIGKRLSLTNIDTGAMYRCVSLKMIENNIELSDLEKIDEILKSINIEFKRKCNKEKVYLDGKDVTLRIRYDDVNAIVSEVSHIPLVRKSMVDVQRKMCEKIDVIMEGRDIGTNVFPNADVKIYLDASPEERASRRVKQNLENGINTPYNEILANILKRDENDKTSSVAPLKQAEDAIYIDSTCLSPEDVCNKISNIITNVRCSRF